MKTRNKSYDATEKVNVYGIEKAGKASDKQRRKRKRSRRSKKISRPRQICSIIWTYYTRILTNVWKKIEQNQKDEKADQGIIKRCLKNYKKCPTLTDKELSKHNRRK